MNVWHFSGRLGADAELRTTQAGDKVLNFRVAVKSGHGDGEKTNWVECSLWGKRAESVKDYLKKGFYVNVCGELSIKEYDKKDNTTGYSLAVRVSELDFIEPRKQEG